MDLKAQIEKTVSKVTSDPSLLSQFQKEPIKAVEKVLGVDLPDGIIEKVVQGVKGQLAMGKVSGAMDSLQKLF